MPAGWVYAGNREQVTEMIWVMLSPFAGNRIDRPLPSTARVRSTNAGMERRRPSSRSTNPSPSFSGRSLAIGSQSHPAPIVKSYLLDWLI
jgi:hypothetical protein